MSKSLVTLIPWDPESPDHIARMLDQRVECGWDLDQVDKWRGLQRSGFKCMYWIVSVYLVPALDMYGDADAWE